MIATVADNALKVMLMAVALLSPAVRRHGKHWQGELFGWPAECTPERRKKSTGSKMPFTPADFWIGASGIGSFSLMWEHGKNKEPVEFRDDRGIVKAK